MVMLEWPIMYCNAFGFIPALAKQVQKVCRKVWGVMFGRAFQFNEDLYQEKCITLLRCISTFEVYD